MIPKNDVLLILSGNMKNEFYFIVNLASISRKDYLTKNKPPPFGEGKKKKKRRKVFILTAK